jgi:tripartite-type tricarboxylate transporter receptor subunit TctC
MIRLNLRNVMMAAVAAVSFSLPVQAQDYPGKDVHIMCAYAPGTGADIMVRYYANKLQMLSGKSMIVENRPGALGNIGAEAVAKAKPDGYMMLISPAAASHALNTYVFKKMPYDPVKDFEPIALLSEQAFVLIVDAAANINSVKDLTARMKSKAGKGAFGAPNVSARLSGELYKSISGFEATQVPYTATPQALTDMLGGSLDFIFGDSVYALEQAKAGRVKALAITLSHRTASAPELPTMAEAGVSGFEFAGWWGAYFPAGTPKPIVDRMSKWMLDIVAQEDTKKFLLSFGNEPYTGGPEQLRKFQIAYTERMGAIFKKAGIEPQ